MITFFVRKFSWTVVLVLAALQSAGADAVIRDRHHLFDGHLAPVSETNPVLAWVKAGSLEIPVSELRAFLESEAPVAEKNGPLTLREKRELLGRLLDEHILVAAYRGRADVEQSIAPMLKNTLSMILKETLQAQEVDLKAQSPGQHARLTKEFRDCIFDQAEVTVSNEAYEELKSVIRILYCTKDEKPDFTGDLRRPVALCKVGAVTFADILEVYGRFPPGQRPDIEKPPVLIEMLRQIMTDTLIVAEARERGLEKTAAVLEKLQINRNVLTRFYSDDRLTDKAVVQLKAPGRDQRVRQWYELHMKDRYTVKDSRGEERVVEFDAERESIENDYFDSLRENVRSDEIRALREQQTITITIDEMLLDRLVLNWPASSTSRRP